MSVSVDMNLTEERLFTTSSGGLLYFNKRMYDWLDEIPLPLSPQQRYEMGVNPKIDHPLHPRPARRVVRQHNLDPKMACPPNYKSGHTGFGTNKITTSMGPPDPPGVWPPYVNWKEAAPGQLMFQSGKTVPGVPVFQGYTNGIPPMQITVGDPLATDTSEELAQPGQKRGRKDNEEDEPSSKRTKAADSVNWLSLRFASLHVKRPEQATTTERAQKRLSIGLFDSLGPKKDSLKRAASTRARRISQLFNMSDPDPIPMADLTPPARPKRPDMEVNIVLLGDAGIGKSQLLRRWTNESVQMDGYTPSTHDEYSIEVKVDGLRVLARFHDAGSARPDGVPHPLQYVWAKGVIICYDINDKESFKNTAVHKTTSTLHEYAPVLVLAGLKKDLRREGPGLALTGFLEQPKQVTAEEGAAKAAEMKMTTHVEVSAKTADGTDDLFNYVVRAAVAREKAGLRKLRQGRREFLVERGFEKAGETLRDLFSFGKK